jgi:hypothetical protein
VPDDDSADPSSGAAGVAGPLEAIGALLTAGRAAEALALAEPVLQQLDPVRDRVARLQVLSWLGPVCIDSGHYEKSMAYADELIALADGEPSSELASALCLRGVTRTRMRLENEGLADLRTAAELTRPGRLGPEPLFNTLTLLAFSSVNIGLYEAAERYCLHAEALAEHASPVAFAYFRESWVWLHTEWAVTLDQEGDSAGADRHRLRVAELVADLHGITSAAAGDDAPSQESLSVNIGALRALVAAWEGRAADALEILDGLRGTPTVRPGNNPVLAALLARTLALRAVGDAAGAVRCAEEMRDVAEHFRADRWQAEAHRLLGGLATDPAAAAAAAERFEALFEGVAWQQRLRPLQLLPRDGLGTVVRPPAPDPAEPVEDLADRMATIGSLITAGRSAEALTTAEPLLEHLDPEEHRLARITLLSWLGPACLEVGRVAECLAFIGELVELADGEPSSALASALCLRAAIRVRGRQEEEGLADLRAAAALARPGVLDPENLFAALAVLASSSTHIGLFEAAERYCVLGDALAGHGTPVAIAHFTENWAWLHAEWALALSQEGDAEGAAQHVWRVGELADDVHRAAAVVLERDKLGHDVLSVDAEALHALVGAWQGRPREALAILDGLREQPSTRPGHSPALAAALARTLAHQALGDDAEVAGLARAAADLAARSGADRWQAEAHRVLRDVATDPAEREAADGRYRELVEGVAWQRRLRSLELTPAD